MQFYRYAGFTVSEKWAEENDNRRVMREKVRKSDSYEEALEIIRGYVDIIER